jgi:RHS repeat-associated protein
MGAATKRMSGWLVAMAVALLVIVTGVHVVSAQTSAVAMPGAVVQVLRRTEPISDTLMPDGRVLSVNNVNGAVELVDPSAAHPTVRLVLPAPRHFATSTVMPDGRILIWGGVDADGHVMASGLWLDLATNAFSPATDVSLQPRAGQTATVLSDGRLLVTGGWSPRLGSLPEAELWDPRASHTQVVTSLLQPPRIGHSATLRADGRVAITDGFDAAGHDTGAAAIFDPATQRFHAVGSALLAGPGTISAIPTLAASYPTAGEQDFPAGGMVMLRFSVPMDVRTISTDTVTLLGPGGGVPVRVVAAEGGRLAFVTPAADLFTGSHYTLFVQRAKSASHRSLPFTAIDFSTASVQPVAPGAGAGKTPATGSSAGIPIASVSGGSSSTSSGATATSASGNNGSTAASSAPAPLRVMTGFGPVDRPFLLWSSVPSCGIFQGAPLSLCRSLSYLNDGAWSPGQDAAGSPGNGHWRINKPDMSPKEIAAAALALHAKGGSGPSGVSGRIELVDGQSIANVDVSIGSVHVRTDATGKFNLAGVPTGRQWLYVDGTSANMPGREYGQFVVGVTIRAGVVMPLAYRMYLPRIRQQDKITIPSPTTRDMIVTHPEMPGLEIHIPAGTVIKDHKGKVVTKLSIVPTPVDRAPFPTAQNFPVYFSIEPAGATVQNLNPKARQGIQIVYPNYGHLKAGTQTDFYLYHPDNGWKVYGKGHVSADGTQVVPEVGVDLVWVMGGSFELNDNHPGNTPQTKECGCNGGDPVDLWTGTFKDTETDIRINDIIPISLSRTYQEGATNPLYHGGFSNWRTNYDIYLYSADGDFSTPSLVLPDGNLLTFTQTTTLPGDSYTWTYSGSPSPWYGATLEADLDDGRCASTDDAGECYLLTLKDGTQFEFDSGYYNSNEGPVFIRDRFGNQVTLTWNGGFLQQITSPSGRYISIAYNPNNIIGAVTDNANRVWNYGYQPYDWIANGVTVFTSQMLSTVTFPDQTTQGYTYAHDIVSQTQTSDPDFGALLTIVDRNGHTILTNVYESLNADGETLTFDQVKTQQLADGTTYQFNYLYPNGGNETDVTDPNGHVRQVVMDHNSGYPVSETLAAGTPQQKTITYAPDGNGLVHTMVEPLTTSSTGQTLTARTTVYNYDPMGDVTTITRSAPNTATAVQTFWYTPDFNQIQAYQDANGYTTTFGYTKGCLTSITDPLGHATSITCSPTGQPLTITDALQHTTTLAYQGYDLRTVTDALNRTVTFTTDVLGRLVGVMDPLGNLTRREYDPDNDRVVKIVDPSNQATALQYDGNGNLHEVLLPNQSTTIYQYDSRNRLTERIDGLTKFESWTYDDPDNLYTYTDRRARTTTTVNDGLGRPALVTFNDATTITPTFDAGDRLLALVDSRNGNLGFSYDGLDRLTQSINGQNKAVNYTYDPAGRRATMIPDQQATVNYNYDNANRLTSIVQGSETVGIGYDNANRRSAVTLPNGVTEGYTWDNANELTKIAYAKSNGTSLGTLSYGYTQGRLVSQTGSFASQNLPAATTANGTFDANDKQTAFNNQVLTYDADGNLTGDGVNVYTWDARNHLTQIKHGATITATFSYDALGRRISKTENGTANHYLYDGLNPVEEWNGNTVNPILTGLGLDERYARNDTDGRMYYLTDGLGSTRALTDTTGTIQNRYDYDPYGNGTQTPTVPSTVFSNPYQYTGREHDQSGLYYNRARYYQPTMGRFVSEDPLQFGGRQINFYAYGYENPLGYVDHTGKDPILAGVGALLGGAWGFASGYLSGDRGSALLNDSVVGFAAGGLAGLTDGLSLIEGMSARAGISMGLEAYREGVNGLESGCVKFNGGDIAFAGLSSVLGDVVGNLDASQVASGLGEGLDWNPDPSPLRATIVGANASGAASAGASAAEASGN